MNIAIAGLGLIGGSFAKAIKTKTKHRVVAYNRSEGTLIKALECGAIDTAGVDSFTEADIILVGLYPGDSVEFIKRYFKLFKQGAIVIDLCGVKRYVCDALSGLFADSGVYFIGGHPMAGREVSGFDYSIPTLFENASMILTPGADIPERVIKAAEDFFLSLGFKRITITTPEHHDEMIAFTSQLAHLVSSAYAQSPLAEGFMGFSAGSFGDMTRVAKLNEDMWTELFLHNSDYLTDQIGVIINNLTSFQKFIAGNDADSLREMLKKGRIIKENLNNKG